MMKMSCTAIAVAGLTGIGAMGGAAMANSYEFAIADVSPASGWSGFYAGVQGAKIDGKQRLPKVEAPDTKNQDDEVQDDEVQDDEVQDPTEQDMKGNAYGVHAGYLHDMDPFVLGGEIAYNKLDKVELGADSSTKYDGSEISAKVLVGYDAGSFLPYATIGYGKMTLKKAGENNDGQKQDIDGNGYLYGIGAKFKATENVLVGAEVLRHEFKDFGGKDQGDLGTTTFGLNLSYKF